MNRGKIMTRAIALLFASGLLLADCTPYPDPYVAAGVGDPYFVGPGYDFGWQRDWDRGHTLHGGFGWHGYGGGFAHYNPGGRIGGGMQCLVVGCSVHRVRTVSPNRAELCRQAGSNRLLPVWPSLGNNLERRPRPARRARRPSSIVHWLLDVIDQIQIGKAYGRIRRRSYFHRE